MGTEKWVQDVESGGVGSVQFEIDGVWLNWNSVHKRAGEGWRLGARGGKWAFRDRA